MKLQPLDLIVRFDAGSNKVLLLVPRSPDEVDTLKRFFEVPVPEDVTVAEFAEEIGPAVASFLHARHGERFSVAPRAALPADADASGEVTFEEARLLIDRLGDKSTLADIETVDFVLAQAGKRGDRKAAKYLRDSWPDLRAVFVRRITREAPGK